MKHIVTLHAPLLALFSLLAVAGGSVTGCSDPKDVGVPKNPKDITEADVFDPNSNFLPARGATGGSGVDPNKYWLELAKELGIDANTGTSEADLRAKLAAPSLLLTVAEISYATMRKKITEAHIATAHLTRCASVVSLTKMAQAQMLDASGTAAPINKTFVYMMKYKLQSNKAGDAESNTRTGLVVLPHKDVRSNPRTIAYAHGGDVGLHYGEIVSSLGQLQERHIVVAPTFPGEQLCEGGISRRGECSGKQLAEPVGPSEPFVNDVDELLGMQNCVEGMGYQANAPGHIPVPDRDNILDLTSTPENADDHRSSLLDRFSSVDRHAVQGGTHYGAPISFVMGASRGGLVANLALAKTGAVLDKADEEWKRRFPETGAGPTTGFALGDKYYTPSLFSCALTLFPPSVYVSGGYRLVLEQFVTGNAKHSPAYALPTAAKLAERFDRYREQGKPVSEVAVEIAKMDVSLSSVFIIKALRNWRQHGISTEANATKKAGAMLFLHGNKDGVVSVTHTQFAGGILNRISTVRKDVGPGILLNAIGLEPTVDAATLAASPSKGHGDPIFMTSKGIYDFAKGAKAEAADPYRGTPGEIIASWFGLNPATAKGACSTDGALWF